MFIKKLIKQTRVKWPEGGALTPCKDMSNPYSKTGKAGMLQAVGLQRIGHD